MVIIIKYINFDSCILWRQRGCNCGENIRSELSNYNCCHDWSGSDPPQPACWPPVEPPVSSLTGPVASPGDSWTVQLLDCLSVISCFLFFSLILSSACSLSKAWPSVNIFLTTLEPGLVLQWSRVAHKVQHLPARKDSIFPSLWGRLDRTNRVVTEKYFLEFISDNIWSDCGWGWHILTFRGMINDHIYKTLQQRSLLFLYWTQIEEKIWRDGMALSDYHNIKYFDWLKIWFKVLKCFILNSIRSYIRWNLDMVRNERHNSGFQWGWKYQTTGEGEEDIFIVGYI